MRTIKKICAFILSLCLTVGMLAVAVFAQDVQKEVTVRYDGPTTFKIGDKVDFDDNIIYFENLDPKQEYIVPIIQSENGEYLSGYRLESGAYGDAPFRRIDENGCATEIVIAGGGSFYKPGTFCYQCSYIYTPDQSFEGYDDSTPVGAPIIFTIEEPVIKTNLPESVKVNDSIKLTTKLTNVNLENKDVAYYLNENNYYINDDNGPQGKTLIDDEYHHYDEAAYQPSVEILEGADIVSQSNQDYSNTLKSSETLTFTGTGTVKLKVKYTQFVTAGSQAKYEHIFDDNGEWLRSEFIGYDTYSPEKIITIQVTDGTDSQYSVTKGANSVWNSNSNEDLTITANGDFSKFTGIMIDNEMIDPTNYEAKAGSTVVTLKASYLKMLGSGKHTVTFVYTDGEVSTQIEIKGANQYVEIPNTNSEFSNTQIAIALMLSLSVVTLMCGVIVVRDKKYIVK